MTKVKITTLDPNKKSKAKIKCSICGLSYFFWEYKILYGVKKLAYLVFDLDQDLIFCHDCSMAVMEKMKSSDPKIFFELLKDGEYKIIDIK